MRRLLDLAVISIFVIGAGAAHGQTVVTACQRDDQQNAGMNLATAIAAGGRITFQCGRATILITHRHAITRDTEIDGGNLVTLDAQDAAGMFGGTTGVTLRLKDLNLTRARDPLPVVIGRGGVVLGALRVEIVRSNISSSLMPIFLAAGGSVHIEGSTLSDNRNGVITASNIDVRDSHVINNQGDGIVLNPRGPTCQLNVTDSEFSNNTTNDNGGALRIGLLAGDTANGVIGCFATVERSSFTSNSARNGGAIFIEPSSLSDRWHLNLKTVKFTLNRASSAGGAIGIGPGFRGTDLSVKRLTFEQNQARQGGGVHLGAISSFSGDAVLFSRNTALEGGGGIFAAVSAEIQLTRGIFVGNDGGPRGGAVLRDEPRDVPPGISDFANSLFARNRASKGAAFLGKGAKFINSTVVQNIGEALSMPGDGPIVPPLLHFKNSIISDNSGGNCESHIVFDDGHNLQFPDARCGATIPVADPFLDAMFVPIPGSPAPGHGDNPTCLRPPIFSTDVYGQRRPQGDVCTIGAVEGDIEHLITRRRPQSETQHYYVWNTKPPDNFLALRTEPTDESGSRILKMPNGTLLDVVKKRTDGWWRVRVVESGQEGWALSTRDTRVWIFCCRSAYHYVEGTRPPDDFLALRTEPTDESGSRILKMPNGMLLDVVEKRTDGWWRVRVVESGQEGWALSEQGNRVWIHCCRTFP
jgi:predicted outer membrane repeat protein